MKKKKKKGGSKTSHQEKIRGKSTIKGFKQVLSGNDGKCKKFRIK